MSTYRDIPKLNPVSDLPQWLDISSPIANQVKRIRESLGMTQDQLAERCNVSQSVIAEIESGKRWDLCISTLRKIAESLNCELVSQIMPRVEISKFLDEMSSRLAHKIILIASGSTAIENQLPAKDVIEKEFQEIKKQILERNRSALWKPI